MPFNINFDLTQPPWNGQEVPMNLSHEEVLHVQTETKKIIDAYVPGWGMPVTADDNGYIVPRYNELDWTKAINGHTYAVIKQYDPEVNKLGINANGIVQPLEESPVEEQPFEKGEEIETWEIKDPTINP